MKRKGLFTVLIALVMISSIYPAMVNAGTGSVETDQDIGIEENDKGTELLETGDNVFDINKMIEDGIGDYRTIALENPDDITGSIYNLDWMKKDGSMSPMNEIMDDNETDAMDNPMYAYDGDNITNNVSSTISGTSITFDDEDYYQINLTSDGVNSTVEKLEVVINSSEAEDKNASLTVEVFQVDFLLGQWTDAGLVSVGKFHGDTRKIVVVPEGDTSLNIVYPVMLRFRSWNHTMINFTFKVEITETTRTEWNGLLGVGPVYNATNPPPKMQSINRSHDFTDWFDLTGAITDTNLDTSRGDEIKFGLSVDVATEERGKMYNPYGLYGVESPTTSIMFIYLVWVNYTSQELNIWNSGGSLPFASVLFDAGANSDPRNLVFTSQADHVWIGMSPTALWGNNGNYNLGGEGNAEMFFNITSISADLIPPNKAPVFSQDIDDQEFFEDEGPWNVTDLLTHFSDEDTITPLRFTVTNPAGSDNPEEIEVTVKDGRYLWVNVTKEHWFGEGEYRVKCDDYGVLDPTISVDDREARSNVFEIVIEPVNDPAYIEKVSAPSGADIPNNHEPISIIIQQGMNSYRDKKIYGRDYDEEDEDRLVYTHNATTTAFFMNKNGQVTFIPTNDDVGDTYIRIWVDDQKGSDEDDWVDLLFRTSNKNDKPELTEIEWTLKGTKHDLTTESNPTFRNAREGSEINLTVTATDPDILIGQPDQLTWNVGAVGWKVTPHPTDPLKAYVTYTPTNDDSIATTVETSIFCMDSAGAMSQSNIKIKLTIENRNDAPEILTVNGEIPEVNGATKMISLTRETGTYALEDELFYIYVAAEDIDPKDSVTFEARTSTGVLDTSFQFYNDPLDDFAGNFTIRPNQDMVGFHTVVINVLDDDEEKDSVTIRYEVVNTNDPPGTFNADWETSVELLVGNNITFHADDLNDPDGDDLTVTWDFGDNTGTFEGDTVVHSYKKDQSYIITVTVTDPSGETESLTRTITIYPQEVDEPDPDQDSDGDGMPDTYEDDNGLNKNINDATLDLDRDGFTNYDEYVAETSPLDPKDHPVKEDSGDDGSDLMLYIVIIIVVLLVLAAIGFFVFVLTRKPKPVVQQMAYAPETGLPPAPQQQLPGQAPLGLPPGPEQENIESGSTEGLPPVREPEEELPESFLNEAAAALKEAEPSDLDADQNVWRPPVEEESTDSQVDDLFADPPSEEPKVDLPAPEEGPDEGVPEPPKMTGLPPPPPEP